MTLHIYEIIEFSKLHCKAKTLIYLKTILPSGRESFHNGFITDVKDDMLFFFDVVLKKGFPICYDKITEIDISRIEMEFKTAWEIYQQSGVGE